MSGLFSPLTVKRFTLKNRIVLPPMANNMSDESGAVTDAHIQHYVRRAQAGVGMVIVEHSYIRQDGRVNKQQLGIYDDALIPGLRRLAEAVKACDTIVGIQITHGGGKVTRETAGTQPVAPSDVLVPGASEPARALITAEIEDIIEAFAAAARRALAAGFDFVEIHGAHGYLLSEFLSPLTNRRTDEYGGDLSRRLRVPLRVVEAVRRVVDEDHLLLYRLGANDYMPGGLTEEEGREAAKALAAAGVDLLDISGGLIGAEPPNWDGTTQGYFVPMAAAIRAEAGVPVVVAGGITDPIFADQVIREGKVDLVAIGRAMLADPDWAAKAREKLAST
ncbi:MAG: NADH:flavin oxidoreductase [Anaerolineae bacterium]|nr:NADH:flavin oxidoreductase [Anaerolineae bacterium]